MRYPIVVCYRPSDALSSAQRFALEDAYSALVTAAKLATKRGSDFLARDYAMRARKLIAAFGVRMEPRAEISAAFQEECRAFVAAIRSPRCSA